MKKIFVLLFISIVDLHAQITPIDYLKNGVAKIRIGDYRGAIKECDKALKLDPNLVSAYVNRGAAKIIIGDSRGALKDYNKALKFDPKSAISYCNRGVAKET